MGILERYEKRFEYAGIALNLYLAIQFFLLWYSPKLDEAGKIYTAVWLILFDYFAVHSTVVTAVLPKKVSIPFFFLFYGFYAWLMNQFVPGNLILLVFLVLAINRMRYAFYDVDPLVKKRSMWFSGLALFIFSVLLFITGFGSKFVPPLGLNKNYLSISGYESLVTKGGLLIDQPHLGLSLGSIYYFLLSIQGGLLLHYWKFNKARV